MPNSPTRLITPDQIGLVTLSGLKTNDVLQQDEFKRLDEAIVAPAREPLRVGADLISRGMTTDLGEDGYLSSMQLDWQNSTEVSAATLTMDAETQTPQDRVEFNTFSVPLPLALREFRIGDRNLRQSRKLGQPLNTVNAERAAFQVSLKIEDMIVNGDSAFSFNGRSVEGLTTAANRITTTFGTNGAWNLAAKTGENILDDVLTNIQAEEDNNFFGEYVVVAPRDASTKLREDFKANSSLSTLQRINETEGVAGVIISSRLATGNVLMYKVGSGSIEVLSGFEPQVVSWDSARGPFATNWAVLAGMSVRVHTNGANTKSPIVHMT